MKKCNACEREERFPIWFPRCGHHMCEECYDTFISSHHFDTFDKKPNVCNKCVPPEPIEWPRIVTSSMFSRPEGGSYIGRYWASPGAMESMRRMN